MLQHGRKSQSPLTLAAEQADAPKLQPPSYFNASERAEWQLLVDRLGDAWLPPQVMALATKLRIAPSSRNDYRRRMQCGPRPWDVEEDLDSVN